MNRTLKQALVLFVVAGLILTPFGFVATAEDQMDEQGISPNLRMVGDMLLVRPLGIIGTTVGTALFVLSVPFSAAGGNTKEAYQKMVVEPAKYTFKRPLGHF